MTHILKRRGFARWQDGESLSDAALCKAVDEMEKGLIDADLGGFLYKKRVARPGGGKSGGYRTLLSARIGSGDVPGSGVGAVAGRRPSSIFA